MFEDSYKSAYTHGLESIYTIETIDVKTVRRMNSAQTTDAEPTPLLEKAPVFDHHPDELQLNLGLHWQGRIDSFALQEPIQLLGFSQHAERCLIDNKILVLKDLMNLGFDALQQIKGIGQGHIVEIQEKVREKLKGQTLKNSKIVDFIALLKTILGTFERKKMWALLLQFNLADEILLTPLENAEIKRLNADRKKEWENQAFTYLHTEAKQQQLADCLDQISKIFIIPWIERRGGLATQNEIEERLLRISARPDKTEHVFHFFSHLYYQDLFPFTTLINEVEDGLFCSGAAASNAYQRICEVAESYFYRRELSYPLDELTRFIVRECALDWESFPEGMIEKTLRLSPRFRIVRCAQGFINLKLS